MNSSKVPADIRSVDGWSLLSVEEIGYGTVYRYARPEFDDIARVCFSRHARTHEWSRDEDGSPAVIGRELSDLLDRGLPPKHV